MTAYWWTIQEEIIENTKTADDLILSVLETVKTVLAESRKNLMKSNSEKCPDCETGYLISKNGKYGAYWSCINCNKNYNDKNGNPDLSEKKETKKSGHKCKCGADLIERPTKKDPNKIMLCCEKCNSKYFEQADGNIKKWIMK